MKKILMGLFALLYIFTACANSKTLTNYELDFVTAFTDLAKEHDENFLIFDRKTEEELNVYKKKHEETFKDEESLAYEFNITSEVSYIMYDNDGNSSIFLRLTEYNKIQKPGTTKPTSCVDGKNVITIHDYDEYEYGDEALKLFKDVCNDIGGEFSEYEPYDPDK